MGPSDGVVRWCKVLFAVAAAGILTIGFRTPTLLTNKPLTEDGFYLLAVARHLAAGHGLSIDGERLTNGIQPLFTFLAAPAYWFAGGDRVAALRGVLLLHGALFVAAAWLFGLVLRDLRQERDAGCAERLRWVGSLSWLASGYLFLMAHNGLETGCALFFYLAYCRLWQRWPLRGLRAAAVHGAMLGVLVLARIDATFFVAAITAVHALRADRPLGQRLSEALVAGGVAVAVSAPWWTFNVTHFGALMPISGAAQSAPAGGEDPSVIAGRMQVAARALLLVATPLLYSGDGAGSVRFIAVRIAFLAAVLAATWWCWRPLAARRGPVAGGRFALALLLSGMALVVYYTVRFWATHFYVRYFILLAPFGLALSTFAAVGLMQKWRWLQRVVPAGLGCAALALVAISHTGALFAGNEWLQEQVALVREHVPPGERIGAGQSGTLGYFVDGVHNLDGKVNAEALRYQDDMNGYLDKYGIRWLCDWPAYLHRFVGKERLAAEWELVDRRGDFELWHRRG